METQQFACGSTGALTFASRNRRWLRTSFVAVALFFSAFQLSAAYARDFDDRDRDDRQWAGTWGASPQEPVVFPGFPGAPSFSNQSIRQIVRISIGGDLVRVRLTNEFGTQPLVIGAAHIGISAGGSAIKPGTDHVLTFSGETSITLPPGAPIFSDPVDLDARALSSLAISIYLPDDTGPATWHSEGKQTAYITSGDTTGSPTITGGTTALNRFFLSEVEVSGSDDSAAVVTFGDSITDGTNSTPDTNNRWPDHLADRLAANPPTHQIGVVNEGISGNRVLHDEIGPNALSRIDRDVLSTPGLRFVTVLIGINDFGFSTFLPAEAVSADDVIAGYRQLIARAHAHGVRIYGATLLPFEGAGYFTAAGEAKREAVNQFIRTSHAFDAVIDFDALMRDPAAPTKIKAIYDSGDHLHPNDAGYTAMANSIDLRLFKLDDDTE